MSERNNASTKSGGLSLTAKRRIYIGIAYQAGYFSIKDFAKAGVLMSVVACVVVAAGMYGIGTITGLY